MAYIILFAFGLVFGSFLNVVIWRYQPDKNLFNFRAWQGRSHCRTCKKTLRWFELVPVLSFLLQKGRCRSCRSKISWQYPLVELLAGFIFAGLPFFLFEFYSFGGQLLFQPAFFYLLAALWVLVFLIWLLISAIDFRHYLIPDELNLSLLALGAAIVGLKLKIAAAILPFHSSFLGHYALVLSPFQNILLNHILGAVAGFGFFALIITLTKGRAMGWGDAKLGFAAGLVVGWPETAVALVLAFILGGIFGFGLILTNKKHLKDKIPFAPFIILGLTLSVLAGYPIVNAYFQFLGLA